MTEQPSPTATLRTLRKATADTPLDARAMDDYLDALWKVDETLLDAVDLLAGLRDDSPGIFDDDERDVIDALLERLRDDR